MLSHLVTVVVSAGLVAPSAWMLGVLRERHRHRDAVVVAGAETAPLLESPRESVVLNAFLDVYEREITS